MRVFGTSALMLVGSLACFSPAALAQWAPVPPPRYEVPPPPVGLHMAWQRGAWDWDGRGYVWRPGHYVAWRSHHDWRPGRWAGRGHRARWVPQSWR